MGVFDLLHGGWAWPPPAVAVEAWRGSGSASSIVVVKLLLLHPLPLDGSIFSDDLCELVADCSAPTLYDEGSDIVDWARAALDAVGDGPVTVIGNSIGGSCAIEVARLAPRKIKTLVLCGAKPGHRPEPTHRDEALRLLRNDGIGAAWDRYWLPLFGPHAPAHVLERGRLLAEKQGAEAIASGVRAFHSRPDRESFLGSWTGRVAIVRGEHDTAPKPDQRLARRLPNASFHLVQGIGHYVPLEAPATLASITANAIRSGA